MKDDKKGNEPKLILVVLEGTIQTSLDDKGRIQSKSASAAYRDNYDNVFKKKTENHIN